MDGSAYALAYLIIYGGFAAILIVWVGLIFFLVRRQGVTRAVGLALLAGLVLTATVRPALTWAENQKIRSAAAAESIESSGIDFAAKRVLFVSTSGTICDELCGKAVDIGALAEVYWASANNLSYNHPDATDMFRAVEADGAFYQIELGDPLAELGGGRYAEPVAERTDVPDIDLTVVEDDGFVTAEWAETLGISEETAFATRFAYHIYEGWPASGQAPIARLLTVQYHSDPVLVWPVSNPHHYAPPIWTHRNLILSWMCQGVDETVIEGACEPSPIFR